MKKPFENWKERIKNLPTLRFEAVDENATTAKIDLEDKTIRIAIPPADASPPTRQIINDYERYIDFEELGSGGTGIVHSCTDPHLNRKVALKVLRYEHGHDQELRTRFVREARVMAQLEHPNILPVHELGVRPNGTVYYSMKQVNGKTLREILDGLNAEDPMFTEAFPLSQLLDIFQHVCHAMAFAHSRGVIHRDLKPENILIGPFGEVLVLDWGLAKLIGEEDIHVSRHSIAELDKHLDLSSGVTTVDGEVSGTPFYMSPEQAAGKSSEMDHRTDIYSLGVILYEILTLQRPISGDSIKQILENVITGRYASPKKVAPGRKIAPELDAICLKAMAVKPEKRYHQLEALIADLERFEDGEEVSVYEDDLFRKTLKLCKRNPITSTAGIAALIAILVTASGLLLMRHVRLTEFRKAGDREVEAAAQLYSKLRLQLDTLAEIQRTATAKTPSPREEMILARAEKLEVQLMTHLRNADYLYAKSRMMVKGTIPDRIINVNRIRIDYLLAKKDYNGLARHMAYVQQTILPLLNDDHPNKADVDKILKISEGQGTLSVTTNPAGKTISLWQYSQDDSGLLKPIFLQSLGPSPIDRMEISKGSYLLVVSDSMVSFSQTTPLPPVPPDGITYFPVKIDHAENEFVVIQTAETVPEGMIYVPGGSVYIGGVNSRNLRLHQKAIPGFFMKQYEVTFQEYLDFWLSPDGGNKSPAHKARIRFDRNIYKYDDAWDDDGRLLPLLKADHPIVGVTHASSEAYCQWLSRKLGREVRLPTAAEWEKSARGVDGREQVWGESNDPDLCFTLENKKAHDTYGNWAPPGSFSMDVSVYGIYDLSGNVREWTGSTFTNSPFYQIKGGSAHLPQRFSYCSYSSDTPVIPSDVGFRYVMPIN